MYPAARPSDITNIRCRQFAVGLKEARSAHRLLQECCDVELHVADRSTGNVQGLTALSPSAASVGGREWGECMDAVLCETRPEEYEAFQRVAGTAFS